ncbi:MAG: hypothetical protein IPL53_18820 [Ignavibacteria bacterium]|nr:hypothetical protein [Ignavibacteria bacterium]
MVNNVTSDNVFLSTLSDQVSVMFKSFSGLFVPGKFAGNYYINPVSTGLFLFQEGNSKTVHSFNQWKKLIGENNEAGSEVLTGNEVLYPKVHSNLSDDTLREILSSGIEFKDIKLANIYGSIDIPPWTSKVIFANANVSEIPELITGGGSMVFGSNGTLENPDALWFVMIGKNISNPVSITAPDGFIVSTEEDNNYAKELTVYPKNKELNTAVFVKFVPEKSVLYYDFITLKSGDLVKKVKVTGKK